MLFLLKRSVATSLAALLTLLALGAAGRAFLGTNVPNFSFSLPIVLQGVLACAAVLVSDGLIHGLLQLAWGEGYLRRYRELAAVFAEQTRAGSLAGAAMTAGEEMVFRGLATGWAYLIPAGVVFGLLHHVRRSLWPFTLWSIWEGLLFAVVMGLTGELGVTMTAHFLHDLIGFAIFRRVNRGELFAPDRPAS